MFNLVLSLEKTFESSIQYLYIVILSFFFNKKCINITDYSKGEGKSQFSIFALE